MSAIPLFPNAKPATAENAPARAPTSLMKLVTLDLQMDNWNRNHPLHLVRKSAHTALNQGGEQVRRMPRLEQL